MDDAVPGAARDVPSRRSSATRRPCCLCRPWRRPASADVATRAPANFGNPRRRPARRRLRRPLRRDGSARVAPRPRPSRSRRAARWPISTSRRDTTPRPFGSTTSWSSGHPFDEELERLRRDAEARLLPARVCRDGNVGRTRRLERRLKRIRALRQWLLCYKPGKRPLSTPVTSRYRQAHERISGQLRRIAERVEGTRAVSLVGVDGIPIDTYAGRGKVFPIETVAAEMGACRQVGPSGRGADRARRGPAADAGLATDTGKAILSG